MSETVEVRINREACIGGLTVAGISATTDTVTLDVLAGGEWCPVTLVRGEILFASSGSYRVASVAGPVGGASCDGKPVAVLERFEVAPAAGPVAPDSTTLFCVGCRRHPHQIDEYRWLAEDGEFASAEEAVRHGEGTFNARAGTFYCTECYVAAGTPLGVAPPRSASGQTVTHVSV